MADYNPMELMICVAARNLEDGATVVVGTGAPCAAAMLSQKTHSPNLTIMFEAGGVAPILPSMPISVGDSRTFHKAILASSMPDIMETCQRGMVDYTFLGGAQIDMARTPMARRGEYWPDVSDGTTIQVLIQQSGRMWVPVHWAVGATDVWYMSDDFCAGWRAVLTDDFAQAFVFFFEAADMHGFRHQFGNR